MSKSNFAIFIFSLQSKALSIHPDPMLRFALWEAAFPGPSLAVIRDCDNRQR
jgi:hypothetical protein